MDKKELFKDIVLRYAKESHCSRVKVATLAVRNGRIIATGINGTPSGFLNCDRYFLSQVNDDAEFFKKWVETEEFKSIHHKWSEKYEVHAEVSLVVEASRTGTSLEGVEIYSTTEPCPHCCKLLTNLKPQAIYYVNDYDKSDKDSIEMLKSLGIIFEKI